MDKIKILIVEDESIVALDINRSLKLLGFDIVANAKNYEQALDYVANKPIDIILMDINLKNSQDGIQAAIDIKNRRDIPIIFLTAYSDDATIDRALECDPIGFLVKPFKKEELNSTIKIAIKKMTNTKVEKVNSNMQHIYDRYYYESSTSMLYYDDLPIKLSKTEKSFLTLLVEHKGRIVTFEYIENYIWPDKAVSNSTTRSLIHRFRCKTDPNFIQTITGCGCRLV
ncbi:response regulator [Halarcobacter ebronensis]|uniref:DNA-binding response regulator n=1 Tax=Halarcobacter ebronensis TaxID=1462615 RepID=A0A4Q1AMM9_9BACT|nr:response regulator [Halarcobacter ebronensis]QKF82745.1 signal transduction response regulator [Halarcobacter ebronensis]RXK06770.1 DNA-binding response regulator [Halarcobacter ebronensis]